jgi:exodeoxyribonuclease VII large subunit
MKKRRASAPQPEPGLGLEVESPGDSYRTPISVGDLTAAIRDVLEENLGEVWVAGEISNLRAPGSGHLYFTLKDASATLASVMFRGEAQRIGFELQDGQAVLARGTVTVYEARGQYQLQVAEIRARGQGSLQQRFEELKRKLAAEGLFDPARKRPMPVFPETIGVVTSLQGAVLQDMLNILRRRAPGIRIRVRGARVQGIGAVEEIARAIGDFSREGGIDLLVVARGGGSLEDLWSFNEEAVARALAACTVPTISAVGHETDFTIADFVADLRAPTPSAAAELLTRDWAEWRDLVAGLAGRLTRQTRAVLAAQRRQLGHLAGSYALREPRRVVRQWAQRLDDLRVALATSVQRKLLERRERIKSAGQRLAVHRPAREIARRRAHLGQIEARLRVLGPQGTLDRGYALALDAAGQPLRQARKALEAKPVTVVLARGTLAATVTGVEPEGSLLSALTPGPEAGEKTRKVSRRRKSKSGG